jgi:RNA polymerase sigma-70 factor, ECF subfamily
VTEHPEADLERLYREHGPRLWRAVMAYAGDREVTNDAVAEAFAQALRRGAALDQPLSWIWRAAFRIAAGELKRRRTTGGPPVDRAYEQPGWDDGLMIALRRLSPNQRAAVILHHYAGYSVKEVAAVLGSTAMAVRVHLSQGRKRLRAALEEHDD